MSRLRNAVWSRIGGRDFRVTDEFHGNLKNQHRYKLGWKGFWDEVQKKFEEWGMDLG